MTAVEVITWVERRRRWSREEKLPIMAESAQPGRTASQVAREHGITPGQLFTWWRQLLSGGLFGFNFHPAPTTRIISGGDGGRWRGMGWLLSERRQQPS